MLGLSLGLTIGAQGGGGPSYEAEATALFARMTTPPTAWRKNSYNSLIRALKIANVWTALDAFYLWNAHDAQAGLLNIVGNVYNCTNIGSPIFTPNVGVAGDGLAAKLNSNFNPVTATGAKFTRNSAHIGVWKLTDTVSATRRDDCGGAENGTSWTYLCSRFNATQGAYRINSGSNVLWTQADALTGHVCISRTGANAHALYRNGDAGVAGYGVSVAMQPEVIHFLADNQTFSNNQYMAAHIGGGLTQQQISAIHSALTTWKASV